MVERLRFRDDTAVDETALSLADFLNAGGANSGAVRLEPGDDARALVPHLARLQLVEVNFPVFGDGRGYSAARILREAGYVGELRAIGDILVDQITYLRRCGFDSFAPNAALDAADVEAAFARFPEVYQSAADAARPVWAKRHE